MRHITKHKMKRYLLAGLALLLGAAGWMHYFAAADTVYYEDYTGDSYPLRLHILADSDSAYDQQLKLEVRDLVVAELAETLAAAPDKAAAKQQVHAMIPQLEQLCNEYISGRAAYTASARLEVAQFPAISYDGTVLPQGEYEALRIVLGSGAGHNWWCVLFPPLCFVDVVAEEQAVAASTGGAGDELLLRSKLYDWWLTNK
ncbi:MAG: stage II sporulation protein R [Firmicutes bacterium]|nr:stage II sporulation protein R [Bacillota bacterium]